MTIIETAQAVALASVCAVFLGVVVWFVRAGDRLGAEVASIMQKIPTAQWFHGIERRFEGMPDVERWRKHFEASHRHAHVLQEHELLIGRLFQEIEDHEDRLRALESTHPNLPIVTQSPRRRLRPGEQAQPLLDLVEEHEARLRVLEAMDRGK